MKLSSVFFSVLLLASGASTYAAPPSSAATSTTAPAAKLDPVKVKSAQDALIAKLKTVDPTKAKAVSKVVLAAVQANPRMAAELVCTATNYLGVALASNPKAANKVIPAVVGVVVKAEPSLADAIVKASINCLPSGMRLDITPLIVNQALDQAGDNATKAAILSGAMEAAGGDTALVAAITAVAESQGIAMNPDGSTNLSDSPDDTGSPGPVVTTGSQSPSSGGGSPSAAGGTQPPSS